MDNYGLDLQVSGVSIDQYLCNLLEKNEKQEIEIERCKQAVNIVKQKNNVSRLRLDAMKLQCRVAEMEFNKFKEKMEAEAVKSMSHRSAKNRN